MGPIKKRKVVEESVENSDEGESSSSEHSVENTTEIQTDFEGRNLEEFDFHGIKLLLQQTFLKAHVDISQVTDMLINQRGIGSVLKQVSEDDDDDTEHMEDDSQDVFGLTTVLNLSAHRETPCVQQILGFFKEQAKKHGSIEAKSGCDKILNENRKIGLLINERFLNIPAAVSAPMLCSLQEELRRIKKKNKDYEFEYFLMICKTYRPKKEKGETSFCNDEECLFGPQADCHFEYNVSKESDVAVGGKWSSEEEEVIPFRRVLLFSASKLDKIVADVTAFVQT